MCSEPRPGWKPDTEKPLLHRMLRVPGHLSSISPHSALLSPNTPSLLASLHATTDNVLVAWNDDTAVLALLAPPLLSLSR